MSHLRVPPAKRETSEFFKHFKRTSNRWWKTPSFFWSLQAWLWFHFLRRSAQVSCLILGAVHPKKACKRGHVTCPRSQDLWPWYVCATGAIIFYVLHVSWCRRESVLSIEADYQNTWYLEVVVKVVKVDIENRTCVVPNYHVPPSRLEVVVLVLAIFICFSCLSNIPWNLWRTWFRLPRRLGVSTWPDINIYRNSVSFAETTWKTFFFVHKKSKNLRFYQVQDRVWTLELFFFVGWVSGIKVFLLTFGRPPPTYDWYDWGSLQTWS